MTADQKLLIRPTSEVSLRIPLNCTLAAELGRLVEQASCGFKESIKRDVNSRVFFFFLSRDSGVTATVLVAGNLISVQHVNM